MSLLERVKGVEPSTTALATQGLSDVNLSDKELTKTGAHVCTNVCTRETREIDEVEIEAFVAALKKIPLKVRANIAAALLSGE